MKSSLTTAIASSFFCLIRMDDCNSDNVFRSGKRSHAATSGRENTFSNWLRLKVSPVCRFNAFSFSPICA